MTISDTARNRARIICEGFEIALRSMGHTSTAQERDLLRRELEAELQGDYDHVIKNALAAQHLRTMQAMKEGV